MMKKMRGREITLPFREGLNQTLGIEDPNFPKCLSLDDVEENLGEGKYGSISEWIRDVRTVFQTPSVLFPEQSTIRLIGDYLDGWFERKTHEYPRTETEEWLIKLNKVESELSQLV